MNFTFGIQKWKAPATQNVFPSNSRPITNIEAEISKMNGPYPSSKPQSEPVTTTKMGLITTKIYQNDNKLKITTRFGPVTCTNVGTSLPICYKKLPRPIKIWRKRLFPNYQSFSNLKPTISQMDAPNTVVQSKCLTKTHVLYDDITNLPTCDGIKDKGRCIGGTNPIRRSASTIVNKRYCTTNREYLQKRCKTFEQNQSVGDLISGTTFKSGSGFEVGDNITGICNKIEYKPSNRTFQVQGGVSASSRTSQLKNKSLSPPVGIQCKGPIPSEAMKCFESRQHLLKNNILSINKGKIVDCYKATQDRSHKKCR